LSTKYSNIARVSLDFDESSSNGDNCSGSLPNDEIVVAVVDDGGDATVRVDLQVLWRLVLFFAEVEVHRFVRQPQFFKDDGDFPEVQIGCQMVVKVSEEQGRTCQPLGPPVWVYRVNCFP
jgi:hypothetical protein